MSGEYHRWQVGDLTVEIRVSGQLTRPHFDVLQGFLRAWELSTALAAAEIAKAAAAEAAAASLRAAEIEAAHMALAKAAAAAAAAGGLPLRFGDRVFAAGDAVGDPERFGTVRLAAAGTSAEIDWDDDGWLPTGVDLATGRLTTLAGGDAVDVRVVPARTHAHLPAEAGEQGGAEGRS